MLHPLPARRREHVHLFFGTFQTFFFMFSTTPASLDTYSLSYLPYHGSERLMPKVLFAPLVFVRTVEEVH